MGTSHKSDTSTKHPGAATRKRILLVDDHPLLREGVAQWIHREPDLAVCGEASTAAEALRVIPQLKPDLVVTDLTLPGRGGLELIKNIRDKHPRLLVLVLSMHDEALYAARVLRAGAQGYVMKRAGGAKLVQGIRGVLQGHIVVSPEMATSLLENYSGRGPRARPSPLAPLSDREFEIFELLGQAKTNREVADQLHLSPKTIETHRLSICRKLKLKTAAEVMHFALQYVERETTES